MSIGGIDVVLIAPADECLGDMILRACRRHWPKERPFFQDAMDENHVYSLDDPWVWKVGTKSKEFFVYQNEEAVRSWEDGPTSANANTMFHFIIGEVNSSEAGDVEVCLVCDKMTRSVKHFVADLTVTFVAAVPRRRAA
jgi:hypothetical protein